MKTTTAPIRKRIVLSAVALLLVAAMVAGAILLFLPSDPVLKYGGVTVTREMYAFWFSVLKKEFMLRYDIYGNEDNPASWSEPSKVEGKTKGELIEEEVDRAIRLKLVSAVMYDEMGFATASSQRDTVKSYYEETLELVANGDKDALEEIAAKYGTTVKAIKKCAALDLKAELLHAYMSSETGAGMTATELHTFYVNNYTRFKVVYLNKSVRGSLNDEGERVETALTEPEKVRREQWDAELAAYLDGGVREGEMTAAIFDEYVKNSDEDLHIEATYPNGLYTSWYISLSGTGLLEEEVIEEVGYLTEGGLERVETDDGVRYIFGYPLLTAPWNEDSESNLSEFFVNFRSSAAAYTLTKKAEALLAEVREYPENAEGISVNTIPYNVEIKLCTAGG